MDDPVVQERERERERQSRRQASRAKPGGNGAAWEARCRGYAKRLTQELRRELAEALGLPEGCLAALAIGWCDKARRNKDGQEGPAWTFPEVIPGQGISGLLCRRQDGWKESMSGSHRGLIYADDLQIEEGMTLHCGEGPTDWLAFRAMGLTAVCRPSNRGGADALAELILRSGKKPRIIIHGEFDPREDGKWPGRDGAVSVSRNLVQKLDCPVFWALPPGRAKDTRA